MSAIVESVAAKETPLFEHVETVRSFNRVKIGALAGAATIGLMSEVVLPPLLWRKNKTEIIGESGNWLALAGLGQDSADFVAQNLGDILGPVDYMQYSSHGIKPKTIGYELQNYYERTGKASENQLPQNIIAHSMGLPTCLKGIEWCVQNKKYVPPIKNIIAISSPLSVNDTYKKLPAQIVAGSRFYGGVISKAVLEYVNLCLDQGVSPGKLARYVARAANVSYQGHPPKLWTRQISMLTSSTKFQPGVFEGILTEGTTLYHLGNDDMDRTVKITPARVSLRRFLQPYDCALQAIDTPDMAHADTLAARPYVADITRQIPM